MKSKNNLLEQLKTLPYFNKNTVIQLGKSLSIAEPTISVYISRFIKKKEIYRLKNGLYIATDFYEKNKNDVSYSFYLANIIRTPSYISSWAALQYYNLTTEAIHSITSITPKVTRDYQTKVGNFSYQSIDKEFFMDFLLVKGKFDFYIARPAKALFDLLYFKTSRFRGVTLKGIETLIEELRIDISEMSEDERNYFYSMIKKYCHE